MSQEVSDERRVTEARDHIDGLLAALCTEAFAHHNYWALHYIQKIGDPELQAAMQAEFAAAMSQREGETACRR